MRLRRFIGLGIAMLVAGATSPLGANTIELTPSDRVIQYTESTRSYTLWDSGTTLPVGGMSLGRELRAVMKFGFNETWRSAAGTAESVKLRLRVEAKSGSAFDVELVALEENFATPIRIADYNAAGRTVWGPVSTASLATGSTIEIDVTDPVRRAALQGKPAAFRIQASETTPVIGTNRTITFAGANYTNAERRPLLRYRLRSPIAQVAVIEPGTLSPADLSPQEQNIADYVGTVSVLANNVEDEDLATYGFITGSMWRVPHNQPYNARVQENAMTMGWFYSKDRPWNPYFGDEALRRRLEAALAYLITLQMDDGHFTEFPPDVVQTGNHKRAPTAFALYYVAHLLQVLAEGPGIEDDLRAELVAAMERAAYWFLNETTDVWTTGRWVSNQLPPGLIGIHMLKDEFSTDFSTLWNQRLTYMRNNAQSSAGFFYESYHVGHNYSFSVMTRDMAQFYDLTGDGRVRDMQEKYVEWMGYNFIPEPDGIGFFINSAVDARHVGFNHIPYRDVGANNLWSQWIPAAAAFAPTQAEIDARRAAFLESNWNGTSSLTSWVSPSVMVDIEYPEHYGTEAGREAAMAALPPVAEERFTEHRRDNYREFLFVRRPAYYLAANLRNRNTGNQRMGLSLFWHPAMGMLIQSQDIDNVAWSVIHSGDLDSAVIDADGNVTPTYWQGDSTVAPANLGADDEFSFTYTGKGGSKRVFFFDDRIERAIAVSGQFREQVPMIVRPTDRLAWIGSDQEVTANQSMRTTSATGLRLEREGHIFEINWGERGWVQFGLAPGGSYFGGMRRLHRLILIAEDELRYSVSVTPVEHAFDLWRQQHFSPEELADATTSGPDAAPSGDGIGNLIKFFLGVDDPWRPSRVELPKPAIEGEHLMLRFHRAEAVGDLSWNIEVSTGQVVWESGDEHVEISEKPPAEGKIEVTARDREPIGHNSQRFMRLVVSTNSGPGE